MIDGWTSLNTFALVGQICVAPRQCAVDYMEWFYMISHPSMSLTQPEDPPRHPPVVLHVYVRSRRRRQTHEDC